jgi:hypothetical protein
LIVLVLTISACNSTSDKVVSKQSTKDSVSIDNTGDSIDIEAASVKSDDYYDNLENSFDTLIGCWAALREGNITITFSKDSSFEFYDYNQKTKEKELLTGRIELKDSILILYYSDRPKQRFAFKKESESNEYRITNSTGYYFIKSPC